MSYNHVGKPLQTQSSEVNSVVNVQPEALHSESVSTGLVSDHISPSNQQIFSVRPPPGRWADNICDWPKNLFPSCGCVTLCCYGMWISAQMAQKTGFSSFRGPVITYSIVWVVSLILSLATGTNLFVILIPMFFAMIFAIALRIHIARKENITEFNGCLGECCCGFWCWYCSVAQMARHLYGYTKVLDGDSDPDRPDNYGPVEQV